ncbi:MAG: bifunctional metallophosphatase/5'-nucleotidase [Oscillospiraceae bacterium]|nr:bifunctional metallophosphatase/5'-nucleotidase [Oscillospiraceae bacterium]
MTKKLLSLLLALIMLCSVMGGMAYADDDTDEAERSADIVILFTSDVHCGIDQGFGYAGVTAVYDYLAAQGDQVILVDDGDSIQGEPIGTMTKGEALLDLMNKVGYSVAIPGNHEFDYGMDRFLDLAKQAKFSYVSCNFNHKGELVFDPYVIRELDGMKVAFVGVTTPKTLTSSTPRYFQDENGEFVYGFFQDDTGEGVYNAVQSAVDDARAEGADYVVVLGHMGNEEECHPWTYADVISHVSGIDVFLDGHSHDTDQVVMKDKDGREVLRAACGTKLACIGWCRIDTEGKISTGLYTWNNKESAPALLGITNKGATYVESATGTLEKKLEEVVANSQVLLTINDPEAVDNNGAPIRMVRRAETNLGDLCADAYRSQSGADIAFVNGGGVRVNINAGKITLNDILRVHPFGNAMCVIEVSGQQILDALEWGARAVPGESGGFLQVSGLSYEIHSYIDSPCKTDENSMFAGIEGERRVKNVLVDGKPIDPDAIYTLASHDYMLLNNGDGYTMFDGAPLLQDRVKLDNQVLIDYITETLGGVIGEEYEDLTGDGRIVIVENKP